MEEILKRIEALEAAVADLKKRRRHGTMAANKARSKPVELTHPDGRVEVFPSGRAAATAYKMNQGTLSQVLRGVLKSTKGIKARFI